MTFDATLGGVMSILSMATNSDNEKCFFPYSLKILTFNTVYTTNIFKCVINNRDEVEIK